MQLPIVFAALMASAVATLSPMSSKHYRSDYEYNEKTDAFYKLHIETTDKFRASKKCAEEGAELATISSDEDIRQIYDMMNRQPDMKDAVMVASQASPDNVPSDQEIYHCIVINYTGGIESSDAFTYRPFACKVEAQNAPYNEECGVYGNDYESRISSTGSCYKASTSEASWDEANANCLAEGAHLVILNNDEELGVVYNFLIEKPRHSETQYFAGVRAANSAEPRVFKTVYNQTLEEVGYGPWEEGEPNDWHSGENCVALDIRRHAQYNDVWCYVKMKYVCESTGSLLTNDVPIVRTSRADPQSKISFSASVILPMYALLSMMFF